AQVQHVGPLPIRWFEGDADGDWDQRAEARRQQSDESPESRGRDEDPDVGFSAVGRGELVQNELHVRGVVLVRREAARDDFGFDVGNGHGVWPGGFRRRIVFLWWPRLRFGATGLGGSLGVGGAIAARTLSRYLGSTSTDPG